MTLRVTIDIFSGRRNPTLELDEPTTFAALALLTPHDLEYIPIEEAPAPRLGYRGLIVEQRGVGAGHLPRVFRVAGDRISGPGLAAKISAMGVEQALISGPASIQAPVSPLAAEPHLHAYVHRELSRFRESSSVGPPEAPTGTLDRAEAGRLRRGCRSAPAYEPEWWNDNERRQFSNNCYNYSTNYRTDTFAQPGRAVGALFLSVIGRDIRDAARGDGLVFDSEFENRCPPEGHLVALVLAPGLDFHWYRKGRDGLWTHKVGIAPATDRDNSGARIVDPRIADRGPYTEFAGYMLVRDGHFKIR